MHETNNIMFLFILLLFFTHLVSIVTQGKHMIPVLNSIGIQAAVYGNHEFGEFNYRVYLIVFISYMCRYVM